MDFEEEFTHEGAMKLRLSRRRVRRSGHVQPPDADVPALVIADGEELTAEDADKVGEFWHRLATNARGLNGGRFS